MPLTLLHTRKHCVTTTPRPPQEGLSDPEEALGVDIVMKALRAPCRVIAENAGVEGEVRVRVCVRGCVCTCACRRACGCTYAHARALRGCSFLHTPAPPPPSRGGPRPHPRPPPPMRAQVIVQKLLGQPFNIGYNAMNDTVCDLVEAGVIDPAKVTKNGLLNSCSIAGIMLTTQVGGGMPPLDAGEGRGRGGGAPALHERVHWHACTRQCARAVRLLPLLRARAR